MPLTVGGGIKKLNDIRDLLNAGADKVSMNTAAVLNPDLIVESSRAFGSQCIVVAIDAKAARAAAASGSRPASAWQVFTHGGRTPTGKDALAWAKEVEKLGAGEILLTSMDTDGTKNGFDLSLTEAVCKTVNIPVIASGGAGRLEDFYDVLSKTGADAALAASVFHYGEISIGQVKKFLKKKSIEVR